MIADDRAMQRAAIRKLLSRESDFRVVGEATDAREILAQLPKVTPDVLLLDLHLRREPALQVMRNLNGSIRGLRVLLLTSTISNSELVEALRLGACGLVRKTVASHLLFKGIRAVMAGQYWIDHDSVGCLVQALHNLPERPFPRVPANPYGLTEREIQILSTIADGYTNKDMAKKFSISEQTVKHHLTSIFGKAGVSSRLELAMFAMNNHLTVEI